MSDALTCDEFKYTQRTYGPEDVTAEVRRAMRDHYNACAECRAWAEKEADDAAKVLGTEACLECHTKAQAIHMLDRIAHFVANQSCRRQGDS